MGDAVGARNGRLLTAPSVAVPDASAAAATERRERALQRLLDPLLDAADGGGGAGEGDTSPETKAFDQMPLSRQLPPHPPLTMMLRDEDAAAVARQLPRFGGARGAHRALPSYKVLAREKLRVASLAQQRETGAARVHTMLRAHASCFSSMLYSSYSAGIVSDALLQATDKKSVYKLLANVFSLPAIRHHARQVEARAEQRCLKPSSLHVHFTHAAMLSNLADSASTTLLGADAKAASGAGVRELLAAKARLQRRDARRGAREANTLEAAIAACGAVPSPAALEALQRHASATVVRFGHQVDGLAAPHGASKAEAAEGTLAAALALCIPRGLRLGDMQGMTFALLEPAPAQQPADRAPHGRPLRRHDCCLDLSRCNPKTAHGATSGFEDGASLMIAPSLHRAFEQVYRWISPTGENALQPAEVPMLYDSALLYDGGGAHGGAGAPPPLSLAAPPGTHRTLLEDDAAAAAAAEEWLVARHRASPPRAVPDGALLAALRGAVGGESPVWAVPRWPRLRDPSWRWVRRWCITARAAAWAQRRACCGATVAAASAAGAAATIAAGAGTSVSQLYSHYMIGVFPRRPRAAAGGGENGADADAEGEADGAEAEAAAEGEADAGGGRGEEGGSSNTWCGRHTRF